ncbi:STAS domain-containing protein [Nocardioides marinquilinus]|uniref:STAS domain-containing protein n=1 Tax=Nocardioides marinquilinus TaxID=1210400 RepID=UPI0031E8D17F
MTADPSDDRTVTLAWRGDIDLEVVHHLRVDLLEALAGGPRAIFVDLSEVTYMDSVGLGVLLSGWKRARAQDIALTTSPPTGQVRRALELMGLLHVLSPTSAGQAEGDPASPG